MSNSPGQSRGCDSRQAADQAARTLSVDQPAEVVSGGHDDTGGPGRADAPGNPAAILLTALSRSPEQGSSVPDLMEATGMSRPWIYQQLRELTGRGQAARVGHGRWRAVTDHPQ